MPAVWLLCGKQMLRTVARAHGLSLTGNLSIGIPGDHIRLRNGIVYLNGVAQDEPQAAKPTSTNYDPYVDDFPHWTRLPSQGLRRNGPYYYTPTFRARIWSYLPAIIS